MGSLTDFAENELLDHLFNAAYTASANLYLVLCTGDPTDAATGASCNEVADANGYERTAITFGAASARRITQNAQVQFPQATGSWGTISHWCIADSATHGAGNILAHGAFSSSFTPVSGNTPSVASGQVYVEISATSGGAGFTTSCVNSLLDLAFRNQTYTSPAGNTFIALLSVVADDDDATVANLTEITGTGYARVEVNPDGGSSPTWDVASGGVVDNGAAITFPEVGSGGWDQVVAAAIVSTASGAGNVIGYDNSNVVDQTPAAGDTVQFAAGAFAITLT